MKYLIPLLLVLSLACVENNNAQTLGSFQEGDATIRMKLYVQDDGFHFSDNASGIIDILKKRALQTNNIFKDIYADYEKQEIIVDIIQFNDENIRPLLVKKLKSSFNLAISASSEAGKQIITELKDIVQLQSLTINSENKSTAIGWAQAAQMANISMTIEDAKANNFLDSNIDFAWTKKPDEQHGNQHTLYAYRNNTEADLNIKNISTMEIQDPKSTGRPFLLIKLNEEGKQELSTLSEIAIKENRTFMFIFNGIAQVAANVHTPLSNGVFQLSGPSPEELEQIKISLQLPSLPVSLELFSEDSVSKE